MQLHSPKHGGKDVAAPSQTAVWEEDCVYEFRRFSGKPVLSPAPQATDETHAGQAVPVGQRSHAFEPFPNAGDSERGGWS